MNKQSIVEAQLGKADYEWTLVCTVCQKAMVAFNWEGQPSPAHAMVKLGWNGWDVLTEDGYEFICCCPACGINELFELNKIWPEERERRRREAS